MADEQEEKPEGETPAEDAKPQSSQETAVGHSVVEEPAVEEPARETAVGHQVVDPEPPPQPAGAPPPVSSGTSPAAADRQAAEGSDPFTEKPELLVAGAFVGAFVFAKLLKKLTRGGD
ncbi:MAG: hypothetical protein QOC77_3307 [Thermoleophilaceae bacterium]|nr:hypothetical protein [Thermoleophilaceae bacterium]